MISKNKRNILINLEKVFVVVDWEAHKTKCDYKFKDRDNTYCGTYGREELHDCRPDECPFVYAIVTEAKEDCVTKITYVM